MYRWRRQSRAAPVVVLVIIAAVALVVLVKPASISLPFQTIPELSTVGFVEVEPNALVFGSAGVVSLTADCYEITANTEAAQAESILNGINKMVGFRPATHDLVKDVFDNLGIKVVMVKIIDLRNSTYIGRLIVQSGDKIADLDSRPSDGIAIAVRTGSPIYIKEDLLKNEGKYIC